MATKRDYYETLEIQRTASKEDMKKSYRRLARQYHPDVNKEPDAAERFKEINEAYQVLSDDDNRARYDRFGHAGVQNGGSGGFSNEGFSGMGVDDIFEAFFGGSFGGNNRRRQRGPQRGRDLRYDLTITFEEAIFGVEKEVELQRSEICTGCNGTGAEPGTQPITCKTCSGKGEVRRVQQSILGSFVNVTTCSDCQGTGEVITHVCKVCQGRKTVSKTRKHKIKVPPGVDNDLQIRHTNEGEPGVNGGPPGSLYVVLHVKAHEFFQRRDNDIYLDLQINVAQAALGDEVMVPTVHGEEKLEIPAGTQSGTVFHLRGMGVPRLDKTGRGTPAGRGDQHVIIQVAIPTKLNEEQKELFMNLSRTLGKEVTPREKGFLTQILERLGL